MKVPITRLGYHRLLRELFFLRHVVRPEVIEELQEARTGGIKIENQQYMLARERHMVLQKKIQDLERKLASCEIVVGRKFFFKQAEFGTIVVIQNIETGETQRYQLVGPYESNVVDGKLSIDSPVGRHLVGRREGEEVLVYTPAGVRMYRVVSITL
ncbi:GreA/GreB family elongation factor [Syntrophobacter fumaroxidans]|uniref:Transcription elongation factor GreA n=1 Tax=Syntrophobacter fumaroxidans (strain DSM 10017 / MPOB) TaxID=335543 RepID=A0LES5_SYNFM|nr:transcription elongation factor GreA [Syntrophobacter fumaroxidans]ABK15927.1 GreA/GreB family elongation factor [Syntrophobacter fumaroxidans MPOB]